MFKLKEKLQKKEKTLTLITVDEVEANYLLAKLFKMLKAWHSS